MGASKGFLSAHPRNSRNLRLFFSLSLIPLLGGPFQHTRPERLSKVNVPLRITRNAMNVEELPGAVSAVPAEEAHDL